MTEIEKLYNLAGVEAKNKCKSSQCIVTNPHPDWCNKCESLSKAYPPFTAEKQIELIKWLLKSFDIDFSLIGQRIDTSLDGINCIGGLGSADTFEDSLCMAVTDLWEDLTEAEQNEIREILK